MADANALFVAREDDLASLWTHWEAARAGTPRVVRLQAPFGGGRRALGGETLRRIAAEEPDAILCRVQCLDQDNGVQWLLRMYGALMAGLNQDILRRGRVEMLLNSKLASQPKRVQGWYQQFIAALKDSKTDAAKGTVQLRLPQDNPLIGLVEIVCAIAEKSPVVFELQQPYVVYSMAVAQFVEALQAEATERGAKVFVVLYDEPEAELTQALFPAPLLDYYQRRADDIHVLTLQQWGEAEVAKFLASKGVESDAARLAEIAGGRPGFVSDLIDLLTDRDMLGGDLSDVSFASLVPTDIDEDELDVPEEPAAEGQRKHATADDLSQVAFFAALLGQAFPSGLVADIGGYDRDSVDDLLDAAGDLFEEVQRAEDLGTWIYKFKHGTYREGVLEQRSSDEDQDLARRVGVFMERFLIPRGPAFLVKTARVYAEHGAPARAAALRNGALNNDNPDVWGLCYDLMRYFDEVQWPVAARRTAMQQLLDRLISSGNLQTAERLHGEITQWATDNEDRELTAWALFAGSQIDFRRQDLFRARDRANDAVKLFDALELPVRAADVHCHLATMEIQDGNPATASEQIDLAVQKGKVKINEEQEGVVPRIAARASHLRGVLARRGGNLEQATELFRQANEISGQSGLAGLALDSGLAFGEALLASRKVEDARNVLRQVLGIAQQLRNPVAERGAAELLTQAEGALRNHDAALQLAQHTLNLTQQLKFEQNLPIDLYNVGFFTFLKDKPTEALTYFKHAEQRIGALPGNHPVVRELYYFKGLSELKTQDYGNAKSSLERALGPARDSKDLPKVASIYDALAGVAVTTGDAATARQHLQQAIEVAGQANLKDLRKNLKKKLDQINA
ncbi:MAG: hypothetical protein EP330_08925 [Deltaproteobacteria bacterium]|nr:MAG: hypothetical protein EP330_08925 [Deltaproteobacteria bacterium]